MLQKKDGQKFSLLPLLVCLTAMANAQATINAMVPNGGVYLKPQLWNLSVVNTGAGTVDAQVRVGLEDIQTHETVLSAVSARFSLPPGAKVLQERSVQPIQYAYGPGSAIDRSPSGMLPVGQYRACYQLYLSVREQWEPASEDCIQLQVEPMSPPLLTMPEDSGTVGTATPSFTWVPPAPITMFGSLNYDFLLTEVYPGQSASEAIQKNLPIQQAQGLQQPFLQYPMQSRQLEKGKFYAWQVVARDRLSYAARSETWVFSLKPDSLKALAQTDPYVAILQLPSAPAYIHEGMLKLEYQHGVRDSSVRITLANAVAPNRALASFYQKVRYGQNFLAIDLTEKMKLVEGEQYEIKLTDANNRSYLLRFYNKTANQ